MTAQAEYSTAIELVPRLLEQSTLHCSARDIMTFLGRKTHGNFEGEVVTDQVNPLSKARLPGRRVKHRMKRNWLKLYDKAGLIIRVETVINAPEEFRVRRRVRRRGRQATLWVPLRKSVVYLFRYREICLQSNSRYLNALAQVDDPTPGLRALDAITSRKQPLSARPVKVFNPLARPDSQLFAALMSGEHTLHGSTNRDLRDKLAASLLHLHEDPYGLVAKIPQSRRRRVTAFGHSVMGTAVKVRHREFPRLYPVAA